MEEKIKTLHPKGKKGVNISKAKYDLIRKQILFCFKNKNEITYKELTNKINKIMMNKFDGSINWYLVTVKLDLEARGIIKRKNAAGSHILMLTNEKG